VTGRAGLPLLVLTLGILGSLVAAYLTYTHYNHNALVCNVGDCGTVQTSKYAMIGPIPIAILGLGMYLALIALAAIRIWPIGILTTTQATIASWLIVLGGVAYAAYLTYLEIWVIHAICQWCVSSAIISVLILAVETVLVWRVLGDEGIA
jgi:uncharacterized membrane protein